MSDRHQDVITEARTAAKKFWDGFHDLKRLQPEWNAQDYGTTLSNGEGANEGYNKADVGAVVFDSVNAIQAVLDAGHATNITNLL